MKHGANPIPDGMKGVFHSGRAGLIRGIKGSLPAYWGVDLVMLPLMVWLTAQILLRWDAVLVAAARVLCGLLCLGTVALLVAVVIAVILGIRNKRVW